MNECFTRRRADIKTVSDVLNIRRHLTSYDPDSTEYIRKLDDMFDKYMVVRSCSPEWLGVTDSFKHEIDQFFWHDFCRRCCLKLNSELQ